MPPNMESDKINEIHVLIATDSHLGFNENDSIRKDDSFTTFEEILQLAIEYDVDFILLGGDLFHDAKPSPNCLLKCATLFRKYCLGDKPVAIEILSDQSQNFKESLSAMVNYEDPNLNVSYPVFSIHGNHDDPIGESATSSMDILSRMGLVNYFGKWSDCSNITVSPILMQKGTTKLALYGLSYLKDQRLARLFRDGKIVMETTGEPDEWFNILTIHQNRADRGVLNFIPEKVLPDILDLVVWGHEHDCRIAAEWNEEKKFHVTQPGSSVATSLAQGESIPKNCGLLIVRNKSFKLINLPLKTVRPFLFDTIVLSEQNIQTTTVNQHEVAQKIVNDKVEEMLVKVQDQITGHSAQPTFPLLRLCVYFENDAQQFNAIRFGQQFSERVANPQDIILLKREKMRERKVEHLNVDKEGLASAVKAQKEEITVEALLEKHYKDKPENEQLKALSVQWLGDAVKSFTQKNEDRAIEEIVNIQRKKYLDYLMKTSAMQEEEVMEQISLCKQELFTEQSDETTRILSALENTSKKSSNPVIESDDSDDLDGPLSKVSPNESSRTTTRGGRGRGSRGGRGSAKNVPQLRGIPKATLNFSKTDAPTPKKEPASNFNNVSNAVSTRAAPSTRRSVKPIYISDSD